MIYLSEHFLAII